MFDEALSVVAIWSSFHSWLTPAVLFVVLNLVIGTIAFTSGTLSPSSSPNSNPHAPLPLPRSPSVLHRLRSFHLYRSDHNPPPSDSVLLPPAPIPLPDPDPADSAVQNAADDTDSVQQPQQDDAETEGVLDLDLEGPTMEQVFSQIQKSVYGRSKSDGGQTMTSAPKKKLRRRLIHKAASDVSSATGLFQPPPAVAEDEHEEDQHGEEVDGKAEDFINRFREQLILQRIDSLYGATASTN